MTSLGVEKCKRANTDRCHRCGGLMVPEKVFESASFDWHCISCGERIDPVILAHRKKDSQSIEAEKVLAGKAESSPQLSFMHPSMPLGTAQE